MNWVLLLRKNAKKALRAFPLKDRLSISEALDQLEKDPFWGDVEPLKSEGAWRCRIGSYRIFYELRYDDHIVLVFRVERRTSSTY